MATESLNNPFADYGAIVFGERFVGRSYELSQIKQRVLGETYGNLAIIGLPRVGKSSLAWQGIMEGKGELISKRTIPIFFEAGHFSSSCEFFMEMIINSYEEVEPIHNDVKFRSIAQSCIESLKNEFDKNIVVRYFKTIKSAGYKTIFVIDEFDKVRSIFDVADFQLLRELSYSPQTRLCLVTCSRKSIEDIEVRDGAISNFSGIFSELRLKMFNQKDVDAYWEHFAKNCAVGEKYKKMVAYYTGNHPYLMDLVNYKVFDINKGLSLDVDDSLHSKFDDFKLNLMEVLDNIVHTLNDEGILNSALQLILGPLCEVNQKQEEKLLKYGVIRRVKSKEKESLFGSMNIGPCWDDFSYLCFSDYSSLDLYGRYYADVPYFSVWSETENLLRSAVKKFLSIQFSKNWESEFESYLKQESYKFDPDKWRNNLDRLKSNRNNMINNFPPMRNLHLVDFTTTTQIFDIFIRPAKKWFNEHIFTGLWDEWNKKFNFLTKLRHPIAHNNTPQFLEADIQIAKGYCGDISKCIKEWQHSIQY